MRQAAVRRRGFSDFRRRMDRERALLQENASFLRKELKRLGFDIGTSMSYIIPIITKNAMEISKRLKKQNILAFAIRPPTVQKSRLRISLLSKHTKENIEELLAALK